jgi:predicted patatin/cPLA2 family phospholipase
MGVRRIRTTSAALRDDGSAVEGLAAADPAGLVRTPDEVRSQVLKAILERARTRSRPGARADDHRVYVAIEGGGMRGAVSAGMCVVLEAAGLVDAFDRIYAVSAGAVNGWGMAVGQAALSATYYQDAVTHRVVNPLRPLLRQPVIDFDLLFEELIAARKPLSFDALADGPEVRVLATSLDRHARRVLSTFGDMEELVGAVRASMSLPGLSGAPSTFRGERMADGALVEPIPFESALREGATHVLVLRSRPAGYREPGLVAIGESLTQRSDPGIQELLRTRHLVYNRQAAKLEDATGAGARAAHVLQVAVPEHTRAIGRFENNSERVAEALRAGARAMASVILSEPIDVCWQPVVYRTTR